MIKETLRHKQSGKYLCENEGGYWLTDDPIELHYPGDAEMRKKYMRGLKFDEGSDIEFTGADLEVVKLEVKIID